MLRSRALWLGIMFSVLLALSRASAPCDTHSLTIAVADFSGGDKELGRFLAETLLTDLAQSEKLNLVERGEIRQALTELKLQSTGLVEPGQVKKLGRFLRADRLIVGSFLLRGENIIVNARLLDVRTGRLSSGGAANVSGNRADLLPVVHRLAAQFHRRVTGTKLVLDGDTTEAAERPQAPMPALKQAALPARAPGNRIVTERDLARLLDRLRAQVAVQDTAPLTLSRPQEPVSRLRALTALVKLVVFPEDIARFRDRLPDAMPPDAAQIPLWGQPYVAAALEQGWISAGQPMRAREPATVAFVDSLVAQIAPPEEQEERPRVARESHPPDPDAHTGLLIDARSFRVERKMGPRIFDEDGRLVYPDLKAMPSMDYLQDHGLAAYYAEGRDARRAGRRPLVIRPLDVVGSERGDFVVSNETAEHIRRANRGGHFLQRWAVGILADSR